MASAPVFDGFTDAAAFVSALDPSVPLVVRLHGKCCPPTTAHHALIGDAIGLASVHKAKGRGTSAVVRLTRPLSTKAFVKAHGRHHDVDVPHYEAIAETLTPAEGRKVNAEVMGSARRQQAVEAIAEAVLSGIPAAARPDVLVGAVSGLDVAQLNPADDDSMEPGTVVLMVAGADRFPPGGAGPEGPGYSKMAAKSARGEPQRGVRAPRPPGAISSSALRRETADADTTPPRPPGISPAITDTEAGRIAREIRAIWHATERGQRARVESRTKKATKKTAAATKQKATKKTKKKKKGGKRSRVESRTKKATNKTAAATKKKKKGGKRSRKRKNATTFYGR